MNINPIVTKDYRQVSTMQPLSWEPVADPLKAFSSSSTSSDFTTTNNPLAPRAANQEAVPNNQQELVTTSPTQQPERTISPVSTAVNITLSPSGIVDTKSIPTVAAHASQLPAIIPDITASEAPAETLNQQDEQSASSDQECSQQGNTTPEFLFQLTKMLTDDNTEYISWLNGRIEVHNPSGVEKEVLQKYFRHSKFSSFQRQMNYFGFRKLAGKGKMSPCSYINEATTDELSSILQIKRKRTIAPSREKRRGNKKRDLQQASTSSSESEEDPLECLSPLSSKRSKLYNTIFPDSLSSGLSKLSKANEASRPASSALVENINSTNDSWENDITALSDNYQKALHSDAAPVPNPVETPLVNGVPVALGMLSRNSSLIDLASECSFTKPEDDIPIVRMDSFSKSLNGIPSVFDVNVNC